MKTFLLIIELVTSVSLIGLILLQTSKGGLQTQGGGTDYYRTKRGAERIVFTGTIVLAVLFFCITVANILVK